MKILSFDQAANISGWSYWEDNKPVKWGVIKPKPATLRDGARLTSLRSQYKELIKELKPDQVLIENPVGGEEDKKAGPTANWKTMQTLCQVQGVLLQVIHECGKPVEIISPSSWQFTCGIHKRDRDGRKTGAASFVERTYKLGADVVTQDEIDSICIAHHYVNSRESIERSVF